MIDDTKARGLTAIVDNELTLHHSNCGFKGQWMGQDSYSSNWDNGFAVFLHWSALCKEMRQAWGFTLLGYKGPLTVLTGHLKH